MAWPDGYNFIGGAWWAADGSGPYGVAPGGIPVPLYPYAYVGTLAGRPAANSFPAETVIQLTDVGIAGCSDWVTDGTDWLPKGRVYLYRETGSAATPLSQVTGDAVSNKPFTPPVGGDLDIPAGLLNTKVRLGVKASAVRGPVATTSSNFLARVGNTPFDTVNGGQICQSQVGAATPLTSRIEGEASFSSATNAVLTRAVGVNATNATGMADLTLLDITTNVSYITLAMSATLAVGETMSLVRYEVYLD